MHYKNKNTANASPIFTRHKKLLFYGKTEAFINVLLFILKCKQFTDPLIKNSIQVFILICDVSFKLKAKL
jgi:hypothetical protein